MPVPRTSGPTRRQFLARAGLLVLGAPALGSALAACGSGPGGPGGATPTLTLAKPDSPVTWDIPDDNRPIEDGLSPEQGATLKIYNYADYLSPAAIASFEQQYGCTVEVSTFNDGDEALTKLRSGVDFDIYNANYTEISRLVTGGLLRPLNHSYLTNISNVWPSFTNPWYDQEWRYTVPYTIYTTGMGWRSDQVPADIGALANPYAALWDPMYKGKTAILDDWHSAMALVLLKEGITDVNTSSEADLKMVGEQLNELVQATSPKVTITMYSDLPAGQMGLAQMWSGDIINAQYYLPDGVGTDILQYWFPADGKGIVDNDMLVTLRGGKNPVLAHLFLNHMLDTEVAKENFSAIGYQPPQNSITPESLVAEEFIPANLQSAVVRPEYFDSGYRLLELDPANDAAWRNIWNAFNAGGS
ncbi:ABC transporter substrate-binding protein [Mycobacterium sp. djl-10]|nr:ABC transporter substrate-binding protein [Mycobacterium sp. djl-10]